MLRWDLFLRDPVGAWLSRRTWMPAVEVLETDKWARFVVDVPGVPKEDLEVTVTGNRLVIAGRREREPRSKEENRYNSERGFGTFTRSFLLSEEAELDHITSELRDGVLIVAVPKTGGGETRKIVITSSTRS
jgi:HSP20 family protein